MDSFESLVWEAKQAHFSGWDFSWLAGRQVETPPPWNYRALVETQIEHATAMLDMDTGGGEFLAELPHLPSLTWATENWAPNIPIAEARLNRLGITVTQMGENDCLPFADGMFDLILNRHGSYNPRELHRVLMPGGIFLTQQVGGNNHLELNQFLAPTIAPEYSGDAYGIAELTREIQSAGLIVLRAECAGTPAYFFDIGAVVYYLQVISWQIPGFSVERYEAQLRGLDGYIREHEKFECISERQLIVAQKPFA